MKFKIMFSTVITYIYLLNKDFFLKSNYNGYTTLSKYIWLNLTFKK